MTKAEEIVLAAQDYGINPGALIGFIQTYGIQFAAEYAYYKANPTTKMDVPSIVYEDAEREIKKWLQKQV